MYELEKGSIAEVLMTLQNIGLQLNDYQKHNNSISIDAYRELLEFSISIARRTNDVSDTIDEIIDVIDQGL